MFNSLRVNFLVNGSEGVCNQPLDLGEDIPHEANGEVAEVAVQIPLEIVNGQLVAILVLAVVLRILLYCVICQVNEFVLQVLDRELLATRTEITVPVEKPLECSVY